MNRRLIVGLTCVVTTAVALAVTAMPVSAHVTIDTLGDVEQGSFGKFGFSVPNERDDAGTVMLQVQMPEDYPLAFVSVQAKPGWEVDDDDAHVGHADRGGGCVDHRSRGHDHVDGDRRHADQPGRVRLVLGVRRSDADGRRLAVVPGDFRPTPTAKRLPGSSRSATTERSLSILHPR